MDTFTTRLKPWASPGQDLCLGLCVVLPGRCPVFTGHAAFSISVLWLAQQNTQATSFKLQQLVPHGSGDLRSQGQGIASVGF